MTQVVFWMQQLATQKEIAGSFKVSSETLSKAVKKFFGRPYQVIYEEHSGKGLMTLRKHQFQLAATNTSMSIWLGKQYLGQHDPDNRVRTCPNDMKLSKLFSIIKTQPENA